MTTLVTPIEATVARPQPLDPAELAAAAFLARYQGRTLEAYRHDLRGFLHWADDVGLKVLSATRPQIELYVRHLEEAGPRTGGSPLAPSHPAP